MQGSRAERADDAFRDPIRQMSSHRMDIYHRNQEYETSRRQHAWIQAGLQNREKAYQDARKKKLKKWKN